MHNTIATLISYYFINRITRPNLHTNEHACTYHYLSDQVCNFPGCKSVLVIDGIMKNRRDVCGANEAGFITYSGLPGVITTGFQLIPAY